MPSPSPEAPSLPHALPRTLRASPGFLLGKAAQQGAALVEQVLQPLGLKARHYGVLVALDELGPRSQHELGDVLRIDRTTMVAIVDHLEGLGFVERRPQPEDRRSYQVWLTAAGSSALARARGAVAAADASLVERLSAPERRRLVRLLRTLNGLAYREADGDPA